MSSRYKPSNAQLGVPNTMIGVDLRLHGCKAAFMAVQIAKQKDLTDFLNVGATFLKVADPKLIENATSDYDAYQHLRMAVRTEMIRQQTENDRDKITTMMSLSLWLALHHPYVEHSNTLRKEVLRTLQAKGRVVITVAQSAHNAYAVMSSVSQLSDEVVGGALSRADKSTSPFSSGPR